MSRTCSGLLTLALAAGALAAPGGAGADVRRAGSVLPPGQSGFVSASGLATGTGSPYLNDQTELFLNFRLKPATFRQPGTEEEPRPGVAIVRDSFGVPAVTGKTAEDVWFGAGYAIAQDRLFQLELFRRAASGRLAEMLGKTFLEMDIAARRDYYTPAELEAQLAKLPAGLRARFDSYRDGVNAWIAEARMDPGKLPGELAATGTPPADWTVLDSAAIGVLLARTVPSGDGEELSNARALNALGPDLFDKLLPLRIERQVSTVPRSEGVFPSQPDRTRRQERRALARSRGYLRDLPLPPREDEEAEAAGPGATAPAGGAGPIAPGLGRARGSNAWAIRGRDGAATLFSGPQLGFSIPELLVELELHGPGLDVRGATAAGVPAIGIGHNGHVAWALTSGLSDEDDLYAEELVGEEGYRLRGRVEAMECRDETFEFRPPPSALTGLLGGELPDPSAGSQTERLCRSVHGPVQQRVTGVVFARRYAIWGRELETLEGLAAVNEARTIEDVDRAMDGVTWNENLIAADDRGHIGYWHPGLLPVRPRNWDERLPYPGTGEAEWRGFLPPDRRPQAIDPGQGFLFQWNNVPSRGWTTGDGAAREIVTGPFHRGSFLGRLVARAAGSGGYEATANVDRVAGAVAQSRSPATRRLRRARRGSSGPARAVLDALLAWDGSYARTRADGTVDPGVAAWDAFKAAAIGVALGRFGKDVRLLEGGRSATHAFDVTLLEAFALRTLSSRGYRLAAARAHAALARRFDSSDPASWREPRRMYEPTAQGAGGPSFPPFPFFDRGTWQQAVELGP